jgi:hypothetical protein
MGKLFGGGSTPQPTPVTRMPDEQDPAVLEAKRRAAQQQQARSGRTSTVLTSRRPAANAGGTGATPGTQAYGNSLLGQAN